MMAHAADDGNADKEIALELSITQEIMKSNMKSIFNNLTPASGLAATIDATARRRFGSTFLDGGRVKAEPRD
jgi:hypothetical protein